MNNEIVKRNVPRLTIHAKKGTHANNPGKYSPLHYHDELELLIVYSGEFVCAVDGVEYIAHDGDVIFVNSRIPHHTSGTTVTVTGLLQFRETDFLDSEMVKIIRYSARFQSRSEAPATVLHLPELFEEVDRVLEEAKSRNTAYDFYIRSGIFRILGILYRSGLLTNAEQMYNSKEIQHIADALSYINEHFQENISLDDVSHKLGFDPSYFCRIFKAATGATFTEYLNFVRVCKAESLLAKTADSILEISEAVGFSSASYFNRIFKRYKGCSPRHYRTAKYIAISKGEKESIMEDKKE